MDWRYFRAEKAKELVGVSSSYKLFTKTKSMRTIFQGNKHFRAQDYEAAIRQYTKAYEIEPELPHYQLNIAAAHLKLAKLVNDSLLIMTHHLNMFPVPASNFVNAVIIFKFTA